MQDSIWCLFSIANNYDQPDNNLVAWFKEKPTFEKLLETFTNYFGDMKYWDTKSKKLIGMFLQEILDGKEVRLNNEDIRLNAICEGEVL